MVYTDSVHHPSLVELARAGNFQAIAHWLNAVLLPHGIRAYVGGIRPGCLRVLIELPLPPSQRELAESGRTELIHFICHRIWKLNSAQIEGIRIAGKLMHEQAPVWEQSVRVVSPARRARKQRSQHLRTQLRQTAQQRSQLKTMRSMLISGPPIFAFVFGCVLGFSKAPSEQTNATASSSLPKANPSPTSLRPNTVQAALETVSVVKHDRVPDPKDPTVTLTFAGDVTLSDHFADAIGKDYERTFANMDEYRKADLGMVNLENPLTRATIPLPDKEFNFKADPDAVKVLTSGGVSLVNLANNHAMDYQEPGLVETLDTLKQAGIAHVGAGRNVKEARRPEIIDVKGQRVAYFGYYGADFESASETRAGTNYADEQRIAEDIKAVRSQVDWVIVNYHWGEELATHPADWQINLAHFSIDQGADVVVGHHPHVLQGAEIYKGRPIAYSMGNFIFGGNPRSDYDTAVLKVALKDKQMKVEFVPVEVRGYQPRVASERSAEILNQIADRSSGFQEPMRSPIALDARPGVAGATAATTTESPNLPATTPSDATEPATESAPDMSLPVESTAPASTDSETDRQMEQAAPLPAKKRSGFANPTDSFITSPDRTPFNSSQPESSDSPVNSPSDAMVPATEPAQPDAATPATLDHSALPGRLLSALPVAHRQPVRQPVTASTAVPASSARSQNETAQQPSARRQTAKKHRQDWVASEHVGAELIPDVSLLAAMAW
ncbi:CapA family protein [Leptolyngbya sp. FACHB-321]|uniref:CapA family protein n=1 Tax=Leptolyngbya sp. FACHB-321 TaxID=2692807 RepID=UPI001687CFB9|nr:CapA family protein [Leptolyngbya sp. FACHB-321]MBD2035281.1 CapA family protein [Leptolyngbya sp. FACHB-321]